MNISDFYRGKKVLITGHTGFKGTWLCEMLSDFGAHVMGYALEPPTNPSLFSMLSMGLRIDAESGDIRDLQHFQKIFMRMQPEIVIHMAAQPLVRESYKNPVETYETNVLGTVNVLECVRLTDSVKSVINVTTDKVYRNNEWTRGYIETDYLDGYDPYSNSKSCSELVTHSYIQSFFDHESVAVSTCRAGNVIGGGDFSADRIIPDCVRAATCKNEDGTIGKDIVIRNPHSTRPYQHVLEPLCAYLMIAMEQYLNPGLAGCYNVGPEDDSCITTGELATIFCDLWNRDLSKEFTPINWTKQSDGGPHEANYLKLDCTKLKETFAWKPKWNIIKAIENVVAWEKVRANGGDISICMKEQIENYIKM